MVDRFIGDSNGFEPQSEQELFKGAPSYLGDTFWRDPSSFFEVSGYAETGTVLRTYFYPTREAGEPSFRPFRSCTFGETSDGYTPLGFKLMDEPKLRMVGDIPSADIQIVSLGFNEGKLESFRFTTSQGWLWIQYDQLGEISAVNFNYIDPIPYTAGLNRENIASLVKGDPININYNAIPDLHQSCRYDEKRGFIVAQRSFHGKRKDLILMNYSINPEELMNSWFNSDGEGILLQDPANAPVEADKGWRSPLILLDMGVKWIPNLDQSPEVNSK